MKKRCFEHITALNDLAASWPTCPSCYGEYMLNISIRASKKGWHTYPTNGGDFNWASAIPCTYALQELQENMDARGYRFHHAQFVWLQGLFCLGITYRTGNNRIAMITLQVDSMQIPTGTRIPVELIDVCLVEWVKVEIIISKLLCTQYTLTEDDFDARKG